MIAIEEALAEHRARLPAEIFSLIFALQPKRGRTISAHCCIWRF
jgi:hypothetical protein